MLRTKLVTALAIAGIATATTAASVVPVFAAEEATVQAPLTISAKASEIYAGESTTVKATYASGKAKFKNFVTYSFATFDEKGDLIKSATTWDLDGDEKDDITINKKTGKITAKSSYKNSNNGDGEITVIATEETLSGSEIAAKADLTVLPADNLITQEDIKVKVGDKDGVSLTYKNGSKRSISFSTKTKSGNAKISVKTNEKKDGAIVKAVSGSGIVEITAKSGSVKDTVTVTVTEEASIDISAKEDIVLYGTKESAVITVTSKQSAIDCDYVVVGDEEGEAEDGLKITKNSKKNTYTIQAKKNLDAEYSIRFKATTADKLDSDYKLVTLKTFKNELTILPVSALSLDKTVDLNKYVRVVGKSDDVTFVNKTPKVIKINNGVVTGLKQGTAKVAVTANGETKTMTFKVTEIEHDYNKTYEIVKIPTSRKAGAVKITTTCNNHANEEDVMTDLVPAFSGRNVTSSTDDAVKFTYVDAKDSVVAKVGETYYFDYVSATISNVDGVQYFTTDGKEIEGEVTVIETDAISEETIITVEPTHTTEGKSETYYVAKVNGVEIARQLASEKVLDKIKEHTYEYKLNENGDIIKYCTADDIDEVVELEKPVAPTEIEAEPNKPENYDDEVTLSEAEFAELDATERAAVTAYKTWLEKKAAYDKAIEKYNTDLDAYNAKLTELELATAPSTPGIDVVDGEDD